MRLFRENQLSSIPPSCKLLYRYKVKGNTPTTNTKFHPNLIRWETEHAEERRNGHNDLSIIRPFYALSPKKHMK